jgi:aspartate/methionine/tyrosine aminotransferase
MNFRDFQQYRDAVLASNSELIDLAETNLWRSLAPLVPRLEAEHPRQVHRCDLAKQWTHGLGLPGEFAPRTLISTGVRDSLALLFPFLAKRKAQVQIPVDVYPVYGALAKSAGLIFKTFPTIPELVLPKDGDCLLLPHPLKPAGRWLQARESEELQQWLAVNPERRLILDAVYTFDTRFQDSTLALLQTGQTVVLHSLSKSWLHPQVFGVALIPQADLPEIAPLFRDHPPLQKNLWMAYQLLEQHSQLPRAVGHDLSRRRSLLLENLPAAVRAKLVNARMDRAGYLLTVHCNHQALLSRHRILSIPLSVFGAASDEFSVLSALGMSSAVQSL